MATANDGVLVTPGSGVTVAAQLVSGKEYQTVTLADASGNVDNATVLAKSPVPADADIVSGSVTLTNSVVVTTLITVPAGRCWRGDIQITMYASGTAAATVATTLVKTAGTNVIPAVGATVASGLCHLIGTAAGPTTADFTSVYIKAPVGNAVTLTVTNSTATTYVSAVTANGILL